MSSESSVFYEKYISSFCEAASEAERVRLAECLLDLHMLNRFNEHQIQSIVCQIMDKDTLNSCPDDVLHLLGVLIGYLEYVPEAAKDLHSFLGDCKNLNPTQMDCAITAIQMAKNQIHVPRLQTMLPYAQLSDRQAIQKLLLDIGA